MREKILHEILDYTRMIVVVVIITTLLNTLFFTFSTVQQRSMEHTLHEGDVLIIEKFSYIAHTPKFGDIVVFVEDEAVAENYGKKLTVLFQDIVSKFTGNTSRTRLVKRVIGLPGDEVLIEDGQVMVNGVVLEEAYVGDATYAKTLTYPFVVPEGSYFVLGDNRDVSKDSRHFGVIPMTHIEGKAVFRLLPFRKFGGI